MDIAFFTEGGTGIGGGHISRTTALADGFAELGHNPSFFIRGENADYNLKRPYKVEYCEWFGAAFPETSVGRYDVIIVDTYKAGSDILAYIASLHNNVVFLIDSTMKFSNDASVLFPSVYAGKEYYRDVLKEVKGKKITGADYLLFTRELWDAGKMAIKPEVKRIGVSVGSSDISFLAPAFAVIGSAFKDAEVIIFAGKPADATSMDSVSYTGKLDKEAYINELSGLDVLICNGGQTLNEAMLLGIPTISMITAGNQEMNIKEWAGHKATLGMDCRKGFDVDVFEEFLKQLHFFENRQQMQATMSKFVDSQGALKAAREIIN